MASFALCLQHGCDGFEFDVRLSLDGVAVVCHDPVSGGFEIERTAADALGLPSLNEVLKQFSGRAFLDIELKVVGLEAFVVAALAENPPQKGFVVSSFLPDVLRELHGLAPETPLGLLCEAEDQMLGWRENSAAWVIPQFKIASRQLIDDAHAAGKKVMVWTVNDVESMKRFTDWGVDAIISDETEFMTRSVIP